MQVMLIDTDEMQPGIVETEGGLDEWYRLLKCNLIDIVYRDIGGKYYDIIADDEGLLKGRAKVTALDKKGDIMLVGNLIICNYDGEGGEASLTEEDIERIKKQLVIVTETGAENPQQWLALRDVGF